MYDYEALERIEMLMQYGDRFHMSYDPMLLPIRKIKKFWRWHDEIQEEEQAEMERLKNRKGNE